MNSIGILSLATVFAAMFALGMRLQPQRLTQEMPKFSLIARCLAVALLAVPALAVVLGSLFDLPRGPLAGLLLVGVSPGAPMALRRSHDSGGHASFAMVLQVTVALLAIAAVPAWVYLVDALYHAKADIGIVSLARQVMLTQLLPIGLGAAFGLWFSAHATRVSTLLLRFSAALLVVVTLLILWQGGPKLPSLGVTPFAASILLTLCAIGLGHWAGGPSPHTRVAAAFVCAMRNPGIALLVASTNRLPETATLVVLAHILLTALLLAAYLAIWRPFARR
jgi:BASS family bile acid:Na+ symporter